MGKPGNVEIAVELAVDPGQDVLVEPARHPGIVVIGCLQDAVIFLQIDANDEDGIGAENAPGCPQKCASLLGLEIADGRAWKETGFRQRRDLVGQ